MGNRNAYWGSLVKSHSAAQCRKDFSNASFQRCERARIGPVKYALENVESVIKFDKDAPLGGTVRFNLSDVADANPERVIAVTGPETPAPVLLDDFRKLEIASNPP